MRYHQDFCTK